MVWTPYSSSVASSCSHAQLEQVRQHGAVRPDTRVQFQKHVVTQYIGGRLFSRSLPLRVYLFLMRSGAPAAHDVSNVDMSHIMSQRLFLGQMRLGLLLSSTDATAYWQKCARIFNE
jgi:hypothetical protein